MYKANSLKKQLEILMNDEENQYCFDCDKKPAHWASVNNSIYLCLDCSGEHRGLGVSISYIRSVTLDTWNENQVTLLKKGGNKRLKEFLQYCQVPRTFPRKQLYCSKIFNFYRKLLKAEANNEEFNLDIPSKNSMLDPYINEPEPERNFNKQMINISDNHYTKNYSSIGSSSYNEVPSNKYTTISSNYNNNDRFASISSEPIPDSDDSEPKTYSSKFYSILGTAYETTKVVASAVKDKVSTIDYGSKLSYAGGVLKYTGTKVYEKGSDIYQSQTVQALKDKAASGLGYLVNRVWYKNHSSNDDNHHDDDRYSSRSSSYYNQSNENENEDDNYTKMNDNKKENLLEKDYKNY